MEMQGCNSKIGDMQMWMVLRRKYLMTVRRLVDTYIDMLCTLYVMYAGQLAQVVAKALLLW